MICVKDKIVKIVIIFKFCQIWAIFKNTLPDGCIEYHKFGLHKWTPCRVNKVLVIRHTQKLTETVNSF